MASMNIGKLEWAEMTNFERTLAWDRMTETQKKVVRDNSDLTKQLVGLEGWRVEVIDEYGERRRFNVGTSSGWRPCHIELANSRSKGGIAASEKYRSVRALRKI